MGPGQNLGRADELGHLLSRIDPVVTRLLQVALDGRELSIEGALRLTETQGRDLQALVMVADEMRRRQVGRPSPT